MMAIQLEYPPLVQIMEAQIVAEWLRFCIAEITAALACADSRNTPKNSVFSPDAHRHVIRAGHERATGHILAPTAKFIYMYTLGYSTRNHKLKRVEPHLQLFARGPPRRRARKLLLSFCHTHGSAP